MANLFLDFTGGNDSNDASSFANRVKTITSGITAARTAAGDIIRLMKSEDPVSLGINATFTNLSDTVTLASSNTANIYASGAWTASANVTCSTSTTRKEGATSSSNVIAAGFTTGLVSYYATGTLDLSSYNKCSFWIRPSSAIASGVLSVKLCTDAAGATPAHTFTINQALVSSVWTCLTFDNGAGMNAAIESVALYAVSDPASVTILLDNIIACNLLTLTSIISLSSSATSRDFYPIKSINGTTVKIGQGAAHDAATTARGFFGTTATATCYKIEPIRPSNLYNTIQEAGTSEYIRSTYSGGWDTTDMSTQTGLTFIDAGDSGGSCLSIPQGYLDFERIVTVRGSTGIYMGSSVANVKFTDCGAIDSGVMGFNSASASSVRLSFINCTAQCNASHGISVIGLQSTFSGCTANNNGSRGIYLTGYRALFKDVNASNNSSSGIAIERGNNDLYNITCKNNDIGLEFSNGYGMTNRCFNITTSGNATAGLYSGTGEVIATLVACTDSTPYSVATTTGQLSINNLSGDAATSRFYKGSLTLVGELEAAHLHAPATRNWKIYPHSLNTADYPLIQKLDRIPVSASGTLTFSVWVNRSRAEIGAMLVLRGGQCTGVLTDLTASASAAIDTWEQLTITCTPAQATAIEFELHSWRTDPSGSGSWYLYFSDFTCKQS